MLEDSYKSFIFFYFALSEDGFVFITLKPATKHLEKYLQYIHLDLMQTMLFHLLVLIYNWGKK